MSERRKVISGGGGVAGRAGGMPFPAGELPVLSSSRLCRMFFSEGILPYCDIVMCAAMQRPWRCGVGGAFSCEGRLDESRDGRLLLKSGEIL